MSPNKYFFHAFLLAVSIVSSSTASSASGDGRIENDNQFLFHMRPEDLTLIMGGSGNGILRLPTSRDLAVGDFDQLNQFLQNASIMLPDTELGIDLASLNIRNLECKEFNLGDLQSSFTTTTDTLTYNVIVEPFAMTCYGDYEYQLSFLMNGSGSFSASTQGNRLQTTINLVSPDGFDVSPPSQANLGSCQANIDIVGGITFEGDIVATVANLFSEPIANFVEGQASNTVCDQLSTLGVDALQNLLNDTNTRITEWLQPIPENFSDPLLNENNFVPPDGVTLLNWQGNNTTESVSDMLVQLLRNSETLWGSTENNDNGEEDLSINAFLRESILDENGALDIAITELGSDFDPVLYEALNKMTQSVIRMEGIKIIGLDTLTKFEPIKVIGNYTINNDFAWEKLTIEISMSVEIKPSSMPDAFIQDSTPETIAEIIAIKIDLVDLNVGLALFLAIDKDKFENLRVGSIIDVSSLLPCFLSTMSAVEISGLNVSLADMSVPTLDGFSSPGIDRVVSQLAEAGFAIFEPTFLRAIPYLFQVKVRDILNTKVIDKVLKMDDEAKCPEKKVISGIEGEVPIIDLRDLLLKPAEARLLGGSGDAPYGTLISTAVEFLYKNFFGPDPDTGLSLVNKKFISTFTESQSGTPGSLSFPGEFFNQDRRVILGGLDARIKIRAYDAYIHNLDTIASPLTLLKPVKGSAFLLDNNATAGSGRPLQMGIRLFFGMYGDDSIIENDVYITLGVEELQILLTLLAKMSANALLNFPVKDITILQCWLATFPAPKLDSRGVRVHDDDLSLSMKQFAAAVARADLNVSCVECTSPMLSQWADMLSSARETQATTEAANEALDLLSALFEGNFLQLSIDRALHDAPKKCPHLPGYDPEFSGSSFQDFDVKAANDSGSFFLAFFIVCFVLLAVVMIAVLTTKTIVRRRHRKWISSLPSSKILLLQRQQEKEEDKSSEINHSSRSLFRSDVIPRWVRWSMPWIILGNIGFFLSGHLSLGASLSIVASIAGQSYEENGFFEFSMGKSTIDIWNAGGQELALLIFLVSFAWPYSKQIITLGLWFASPNVVSVERRGAILLWLDALAKWSFADIFVLILTIVSFRVSVKSPENGLLPPDLYSINLLVIPKWGLYANMTAQLITQISSHFIIHFHRRAVQNAEQQYDHGIPDHAITSTVPSEEDEESQGNPPPFDRMTLPKKLQNKPYDLETDHKRLSDHAFRRFHRGESDKIVPRSFVNPILVLLSAALSLLVVIGCIVPSYAVSFLGIVGILVESGQGFAEAKTDYSVMTTVQLLFDQARFTGRAADYVGLGTLSVLLILTVLIVPLLQSMLLLVQWFMPLTRKRRHQLSTALEIFQAWQYIEVYLLSLLVASWQLGGISEAMVNPYCEPLRGVLAKFVYYGLLKDEDAQCFKVNIDVEPTFYILFAAALAMLVVNSFVMKAVSQYFCELYTDWDIHSLKEDDLEADSSVDRKAIHPVPIMFTDQFRWVLHREDAVLTRPSSSVGDVDSPRVLSLGTKDDTEQGTFSHENDAVASETNNIHYLSPADRTIPYSSQSSDDSGNSLPSPDNSPTRRKGKWNSVAFYDEQSAASDVDKFSSHRVIGVSSSSLDGIAFVPTGSQSIAALDGKSPVTQQNPNVSLDDIVSVSTNDRSDDVFFQTASWDSFGGPNRKDLRPGLQLGRASGKIGDIESSRSWNESTSKASVVSSNSLLIGQNPSGVMEKQTFQTQVQERGLKAPKSVDDFIEGDYDDASSPGLEGTAVASNAYDDAPSQTLPEEPRIGATASQDLSIKLSLEDDYMGSFDSNSVQSPRTDLQMS